MMKRKNTILLAAILLFGFAGLCFAQTAQHDVTIVVEAINEIGLSNTGTVSLTINLATAGSAPDAAEASGGNLMYTTNQVRKITAHLSDAYPAGITLAVSASNGSGGAGTALGTGVDFTNLSTAAVDVVTGINQAYSTSALNYRASAAITAALTGGVISTVTYTIVE